MQFLYSFDSFLAVLCLTTHRPSGSVFEIRPKDVANGRTVIDDQNCVCHSSPMMPDALGRLLAALVAQENGRLGGRAIQPYSLNCRNQSGEYCTLPYSVQFETVQTDDSYISAPDVEKR